MTNIHDSAAPTLESLSLSSTNVDLSTNDVSIKGTIRVIDNYSGLQNGHLEWISPSGNIYLYSPIQTSNLKSGDLQDGIYEINVDFKQGHENGNWKLSQIALRDNNHGYILFNNSYNISNWYYWTSTASKK